MSNTVSLCMIVKNEERFLPACLKSVKDIVDEIILLDTGSTDNTLSIAKSFSAIIHFYKWNNNFSDARNESLKYATKDWILIMDGDDEFCSEDLETFKQLINSDLDENAVYFFETLNYGGNSINDNDICVNLNPRLFKNNHGFHYEGAVHNQLVNSLYSIQDISCPIKIYHYGYLSDVMASKQKRSRNIPLLEEQLKQDPENKYAHFNLANEYYSEDNYSKALEHYNKAFENFNPNSGYGFILIARIVVTAYTLGQYDKALEIADIGIKYYPQFTDLYYLKSLVYNRRNMPTLEISTLEKCIELGDPPLDYRFIYGTGSFKAHYDLANVYMRLKDYDSAYNCYVDTIRSKPDFISPVYHIGHILREKNTAADEFKKTLESFFADYPKAYQILADISYFEGYYDIALEYIKKCEGSGMIGENLMLLKVRALLRTGAFDQCLEQTSIQKGSSFYFIFSMYKALSSLLIGTYGSSKSIIESFEIDSLSDYNKKMLLVYSQLIKLFANGDIEVISEDEKEKEYTPIIFEICEILLINKRYDEFERTLGLLNLISDKSVLLALGKLYNKYGFKDLAKKEIIRSIKEFEVYDTDGLDILR